MTIKRNTICFAYYGDDKFLGWYADSFGSIRKNSPKVYGDSEGQLETIEKNFRSKIKKARLEDVKKNHSKKYFGIGPDELIKMMVSSQIGDYEKINAFRTIELRIVDCPYYDGPNPNFNREDYIIWRDIRHQAMSDAGIFDISAPSKERSTAIEEFDQYYAKYPIDRWVYVDNKIKEWASKEPTETTKFINSEIFE